MASNRLHVLHIGKAGGTAVRAALSPVARARQIYLHPHGVRLADTPAGDRVTFFLREPISRFVSGFNSRLRKGRPRYNFDWNEGESRAFARFKTPNELAESLDSENTADRAAAEDAMHEIIHVNSSFSDWFEGIAELELRKSDIVLLGLQECLLTDFLFLKKSLELPAYVDLPLDEVRSHKTPSSFETWLSDRALLNLNAWYASDIAFFKRYCELRFEWFGLASHHEA